MLLIMPIIKFIVRKYKSLVLQIQLHTAGAYNLRGEGLMSVMEMLQHLKSLDLFLGSRLQLQEFLQSRINLAQMEDLHERGQGETEASLNPGTGH